MKKNNSFNIAVIGSGYVGLTTGACFAEYGHKVICVDNDINKINSLKKNIIPIYEPGLQQLVSKNVKSKRLSFSASIKDAVQKSQILFICVGTPSKEDGEANLVYVEKASQEIAQNLNEYKIIVEKSTVPVETGEWVYRTIKREVKKNIEFDVASNPEFLREGSAVKDALCPERIVVGVNSERAKKIFEQIYKPFKAPVIFCDTKTAELIKHSCNAFLALKISYINAIARVCENVGADITKVAQAMGYDKRIGGTFLNSGIGYGGSCFPKDIAAFIKIAEKVNYDFDLLKAVQKINSTQKSFFVEKIKKELWNLEDKTIAVWGLSFKPDTDDLRIAPALEIIELLKQYGAKINVYDPQAMEKAKEVLAGVKFAKDAKDCVKNCDCLILATEWKEFLQQDFKEIKKLMKHSIIADGRNALNKEELLKLGFRYIGVGR